MAEGARTGPPPPHPLPLPELGARNALLLWGGVPLVAGLALVGTGAEEGAALALAGAFNVIYGIHKFGRLGPDDLPPCGPPESGPRHEEASTEGARLEAASYAVWTGAATLVGGLAVAIDGHFVRRLAPGGWAVTAYAVMAVGLLRLWRGVAARGAARPARAARTTVKVEKERRLGHRSAP